MATHTSSFPAEALAPRERRPSLQTLVGARSGCARDAQALSANEQAALLSAIGGDAGGLFLTNDDGLFLLPTRGAAPGPRRVPAEQPAALRERIVRLSVERLRDRAVARTPGRDGIALNAPGSTLVIPVADVARQLLATIRQHVRDGRAIVDDRSRLPIAGIEHYADLLDLDAPLALSRVEAQALAQASAELSAGVRAGLRALDRLGLAGSAPGDVDGVELLGGHARDAFPPPQLADLESATRAIEAAAPAGVRPTRAERRAVNAAGLIAQHVHAVHGRFPATVPALSAHGVLQARRVGPGAAQRAAEAQLN